jgi:hypothetical protein
VTLDPYREIGFNILVRAWRPLTYAVNGLNHSAGEPSLYLSLLAPTVMGKLRFIPRLVHQVKLPDTATSLSIAT